MDFNKLRTYILEDEFEMKVLKDRVDVINYKSIGHLDSNKIIIRHNDGSVVINGRNLVVSKLVKEEILIVGSISNIELRNTNEWLA